MATFRVRYYYLATGMEGQADDYVLGDYQAKDEDEACRIAAEARNPGRPDLVRWDLGCLSARQVVP